ncbi:MAG: metallophosphoesterase [Patescibacteria group bacterium]|jgi:alkaline phosphatase
MKFVILTDIHLGPEAYYKGILRKINKDAKIFLDKFIKEMNKNIKPEFIVVLGDLIEDENPVSDRENITYVIESLKKLNCPVYYVAGNHDLKGISENELTELFNYKKLHYSFDQGDFHGIVLFSKAAEDKSYYSITDEQENWLKEDLNKTNKKCLVFVHYGLADQDLAGNPWFEGRPNKCLVFNRKEIRSILEKSKKVIAVFNSHLHWDRKDVHNNIPYFTIQSLIENEDDKGIASEAYAIINIIDDKIDVEIKGNYSKRFLH